MYFKYSYLACVICALCGLVTSEESTNASGPLQKVNIYYDTVDPKCIQFFSSKFQHAYHSLDKYIDANLVPFGKAQMVKEKMSCTAEHGEVECYANRVHACALNYLPKTIDKLKFVICTMQSLNDTDLKNVTTMTYPTQKCIDSVNVALLNKTSLETCMASTELNQVLWKYSNETKQLGTVNDWPVITLNAESYDAKLSQNLVNDFANALCQKIVADPSSNQAFIAHCNSTHGSSTPKPPPTTVTPEPSHATTVNSITYWPIVIATTFTIIFGVKLG